MSMSTTPARPLPRWLIVVGTLGIAFHLLAVVVVVIAAPSGPFPTPVGPLPFEPPAFVWRQNAGGQLLNEVAADYLRLLHLGSNYHFSSNKLDYSAVWFEVRLKGADGAVFKTLKFPEDDANFWVRHREGLLAQNIGDDQNVQSNRQNTLPAEGERVQRVQIWKQAKPGDEFHLESVPVSSLSRTQPENGPSAWSQLLAKAYVRYLERKYGEERGESIKGELIRHSRNPIPPVVVVNPQDLWPPNVFNEMVADFTEREP
jgi:hypothetical protein